jgi:hypothetical protein
MPGSSPGMTEGVVRPCRLTDSNIKQPSKIARVLCGAGYAVVPFSFPSNTRGWRAEKARQVVRLRIFLLGRCGAFRRAIAASYDARAALSATACGTSDHSQNTTPFGRPCRQASNEPCGPPSASSWQEVIVPPSGAPSPPERVACEATPAGAAFCSTIKTPHDSALVEQDMRNISPPGVGGDKFFIEMQSRATAKG